MSKFTILHNPKCTKSRLSLALLEQHQVDFDVILYLQNPPNPEQLADFHKQLDLPINAMLRTQEAEFKEHLAPLENKSEQQIFELAAKYPKVIERPIVSDGNKAVIGRPPENLLAIL